MFEWQGNVGMQVFGQGDVCLFGFFFGCSDLGDVGGCCVYCCIIDIGVFVFVMLIQCQLIQVVLYGIGLGVNYNVVVVFGIVDLGERVVVGGEDQVIDIVQQVLFVFGMNQCLVVVVEQVQCMIEMQLCSFCGMLCQCQIVEGVCQFVDFVVVIKCYQCIGLWCLCYGVDVVFQHEQWVGYIVGVQLDQQW